MNNTNSIIESEYNSVNRILNYRLPSVWKKIGIIGAVSVLVFLIFSKFYGSIDPVYKDVLRGVILLLLFLASLSRDTDEDEYLKHLKSQSYIIASIAALAYSIGIPLIAFVLDLLICKITGDGSPSFYKISAFEVIFSLLGFQLLFYETLKRLASAE